MEYSGLVDEDCGAAAAFGTMGGELAAGDVIEELLMEGCWVEASENNYLMGMQQAPQYMGGEGEHFNQQIDQCESGNFVVGKRWWIGPRANPGPSSSVKERLVVAVGYLKEYTKNTNVLIQIWVPLRRRGLHNHYHYHSANPVDEESIPVGNFPNPNVNVQVRFYRSHEYHRVQAQQYGSLALPVFERGSGTCLGVVEIVMTNQTPINYRPQLDHLSNALQGVDFRTSSHNHHIHHHHHQNMLTPAGGVKVFEELYEAAVSEIMEVLASVCKTHNLPLALTWAPCIQQGKGGCGGVSNSTSISCVSTVDSACFLGDVDVLGFQEACYEYHLFHGQGIVGTAFTTTKPCFAIDITAFSKAEYPLANHAKLFGLHAAVAIPLRSVYTGSAADFVLEFFLPKECRDPEEQKHMLNSLSLVVQQACRSLHLHVVMEDDYALPLPPPTHTQQQQLQVDHVHDACSNSKESSSCSWIAHMMEAQHKGKGVSVSLEYLQEPKEEFKVTTNWERDTTTTVFADFGGQVMEQSSNSRASVSVDGGEESAGGGGSGRRSSSSGGRKSGDKRRTKAEKTISLPVLRQYFAGSLKDAAKSIGGEFIIITSTSS